jgi:hypothetical protein
VHTRPLSKGGKVAPMPPTLARLLLHARTPHVMRPAAQRDRRLPRQAAVPGLL